MSMERGYAAYLRYVEGRKRPDGSDYPAFRDLTRACQSRWSSLAESADSGGGVVPKAEKEWTNG